MVPLTLSTAPQIGPLRIHMSRDASMYLGVALVKFQSGSEAAQNGTCVHTYMQVDQCNRGVQISTTGD